MKKLNIILTLTLLLFLLNINNVNAKSIDCSKALIKGSKGENVSTLQLMLNKTSSCNLKVDGSFGTNTYNCVIKFQSKNNLEKDGKVGPQTCKKLNSIYNKNVKPVVVITAKKLNVRKGTGTNYPVITTVKQGQILEYYNTKNINGITWYKIKANNSYGYVSGNYAKNRIIVVDISDQVLIYYKNGKEELYSSVVTGTKGKNDTPTGKYELKVENKARNRILMQNSHVKYWMPFILDRGIGFHDADWRSNFGGTIYKTNGSHGCINMPNDQAKNLYNSITNDIDIIIKN